MSEPIESSEEEPSAFLSPELLLAAIVDSSDDVIVSKNLKGIVTSWNAGAKRVFGYEPHEMIGQPILRLIPPDRRNEEDLILERLRRGERIDHFETVRVGKDGRPIEVSLTISPVRNTAGAIVGASKIARDITEQKRLVRQLSEANERLSQADRMKVEFISTLSHELRTPLNAIVGWVQMLKEGATREETQEGLAVIERNIRVQSQLINDLLDMSRIESGKLSLDIQRIDLPTAITAAIDSIRPTAVTKDVRVTSAFASVNGIVMGDKNRLQQIIWNLLTNAIKFTPKGGRIHVTLARVNSHVEIAVADNGVGISPEYLPHIFERFSQADASSTRRHGGLGLGLSIAKHLVELHGGTISARSEGVGRGTTFRVDLPLLPVHQDSDQLSADQRSAEVGESCSDQDLQGVKVLIVEDEADSAEVVRRILDRRGAIVTVTNEMEGGLAAFQKELPDVILSDIGMPEHDGYEFMLRLRALPNGQSVPAVALTALARSEDRTKALRAGFQMHVAKPVDAEELVAVVRNLANLRAQKG